MEYCYAYPAAECVPVRHFTRVFASPTQTQAGHTGLIRKSCLCNAECCCLLFIAPPPPRHMVKSGGGVASRSNGPSVSRLTVMFGFSAVSSHPASCSSRRILFTAMRHKQYMMGYSRHQPSCPRGLPLSWQECFTLYYHAKKVSRNRFSMWQHLRV